MEDGEKLHNAAFWGRAADVAILVGVGGGADITQGRQQGKLLVSVAPVASRVARTEEIDGVPTAVRSCAARNEFEPFQVIVRAETGPVKGFNATASDLASGAGHRIQRNEIRLFREYYLYVIEPSANIGWMPRIEYPGPLLPFRDPYDDAGEPYGAPFDKLPHRHGRFQAIPLCGRMAVRPHPQNSTRL